MQNRFLKLIALLVLALVVTVAPLAAHEGRAVGDYTIVFGWQVEPAYAGVHNGPEVMLQVHSHNAHSHDDAGSDDHGHEEAFPADIEVSLKADVTFGDQEITINLRKAHGTTGYYIAQLTPTLPGDYTFRIYGTIGDTEVDEVFSSIDGQFSSVEPAEDILFPSETSLYARIAALEAIVAELQAALEALQ